MAPRPPITTLVMHTWKEHGRPRPWRDNGNSNAQHDSPQTSDDGLSTAPPPTQHWKAAPATDDVCASRCEDSTASESESSSMPVKEHARARDAPVERFPCSAPLTQASMLSTGTPFLSQPNGCTPCGISGSPVEQCAHNSAVSSTLPASSTIESLRDAMLDDLTTTSADEEPSMQPTISTSSTFDDMHGLLAPVGLSSTIVTSATGLARPAAVATRATSFDEASSTSSSTQINEPSPLARPFLYSATSTAQRRPRRQSKRTRNSCLLSLPPRATETLLPNPENTQPALENVVVPQTGRMLHELSTMHTRSVDGGLSAIARSGRPQPGRRE